MLVGARKEDIEQYMDLAYSLALDQSRSGYPLYTDGIKQKKTFVQNAYRSFTDPDREILLFRKDGTVLGWIQFFVLTKDLYLQTDGFFIARDTETALEEFLQYIGDRFRGYTAYLGFPKRNAAAVSYLQKNRWDCLDEPYNDVLFFKDYTPPPERGNAVRVDRENFRDFRALHTNCDMYWNADRIYAALSQWNIHLCYREGRPAGAVYERNGEISGMDFLGNSFDKTFYRDLLTAALNDLQRQGAAHVNFFHDEESQSAALEMGFRCVGEYMLFGKKV